MKKLLLMIFLPLFLMSLSLAAQEMNYRSDELCIDQSIALRKIYVHHAQIHVIPEGIFFVNHEGSLEHACGIFHDTGGSYVMALDNRYKCPGCGFWNNDNICHNKRCALYMKLACILDQ